MGGLWLLTRLGYVEGLHASGLVSGDLLDELMSFFVSFNVTSDRLSGMKNAAILKSLLLCVSLEVEPGPCPVVFCLHPPCFCSRSLQPFPSLSSNCFNLPFRTQGKSWGLKSPTGSRLVSVLALAITGGMHGLTRLPLPPSLSSSIDVYCVRREIATELGLVITGAAPNWLQ